MKTYGNKKKIIDYFFWVVLIIFTNPGGILQLLSDDRSDGSINLTDFLFVLLALSFVVVFNKNSYKSDKTFMLISKILVIFLLYYVVVFGFFIPQFKNFHDYSLFKTLIKIRHGIFNIFLVQFVYLFYLRSYKIFFKLFIASSIIILSLFIFSVVIGIEILPLKVMDRRFIKISRMFMISYGLMPLLMSMGIVLLVFKFKVKYKKLILLGFVLMSLTWVLSLTRREIFGAIVLFVLTAIISNYIYKKSLIPVKKSFLILFYVAILLFIIKLSFPKYMDAIGSSAEQTYHVFKYGETLSGKKDKRLGFGKKELQDKIVDNFVIGTGFDNNWRVSEEAGYEASDYPFLAAIAMVGVIGLLFFIPVYFNLYKTIYKDLNFLRKNKIVLNSFELYVLLSLLVYFIFEILNYTYWFLPVSLFTHSNHHKWYILLASFLAARKVFYYNNKLKISGMT